jgi:hypothetical protein
MASLKECRENAAECFDWAKQAKSVKEQEIFLQMAGTWLMAAANLAKPRHGARTETSPTVARSGRTATVV